MFLETGWVDVAMGGETCSAYRARPMPASERLPGILLIQEIWGVDEHIQDVTQRFATAGYLALAPDLHARGARRPELEPERIQAVKRFLDTLPPQQWGDPAARTRALEILPPAERESTAATLGALFGPRDLDAQVSLLRQAVAFLRADAGCDGVVGCVGWCMGGTLSGLLACREPSLSAAVVFYGMPPTAEDIGALACPVLGLYGALD
jgi:carboxymethylenebutenolidase